MAASAVTASSAVENAWRPGPVGTCALKPVSWTTTGFPQARYAALRVLNQPLRVAT